MNDKIIVSNRAALTAKYGSAGVQKIKQAVTALIAADAKRGIKSRLVYLDDPVAMESFAGNAVTDPANPRQQWLCRRLHAACRADRNIAVRQGALP